MDLGSPQLSSSNYNSVVYNSQWYGNLKLQFMITNDVGIYYHIQLSDEYTMIVVFPMNQNYPI